MGSATYSPSSIWQKIEMPVLPPLDSHLTTEVCIVGAGIAGLTTAYQLLRRGKKVIVLEKNALGSGETGLTSAHLSSALDDRFKELIQQHGERGARLAYESHAAAIDEIERIQAEEGINCEFQRVDGYLFSKEDGKLGELREELDACRRLGIEGVHEVSGVPLKTFDSGPALMFPRQAQFHPLKFLRGLVGAVLRMGGEIYAHTGVREIDDRVGGVVQTENGFRIACQSIVMATGVPIQGRFAIHTKEAAYRSYIVVLEVESDLMKPCLLWDTEEPYHYVRLENDEQTGRTYLIVGGEDHKTGQDALPAQHFANLQDWIYDRLGIEGRSVGQWSGQIVEPVDSLAFIGRHPSLGENVYMISGDSGHGLTHGVLGSLILSDLIMGEENEWTSLYDPSRKSWTGLGAYLSENTNVAAQYMDWMSLGDVASESEIPPGEGAVIRSGLKKMAVYRDQEGTLHRLSATCPHLGGIVRWNSAEKTWDCPCHGSRFDSRGTVLNGPAVSPLEAEETSEETGERETNAAKIDLLHPPS
ncbi:MAG TPA: FAD-dependent oxidoreductase [Pseudobdellovibrionaceae bacterium]|nr:FAD-dependent oxidoreductase [Pseudobdellovibrionaceae bacterium]